MHGGFISRSVFNRSVALLLSLSALASPVWHKPSRGAGTIFSHPNSRFPPQEPLCAVGQRRPPQRLHGRLRNVRQWPTGKVSCPRQERLWITQKPFALFATAPVCVRDCARSWGERLALGVHTKPWVARSLRRLHLCRREARQLAEWKLSF